MSGIGEVADVVGKIANGIEQRVADIIANNRELIIGLVQEQIYSGLRSDGQFLSPTYDDDPYFQERGQWYGKARQYKLWKMKITPPIRSYMLNLPPRPDNVPNLFITGTFFDSIQGTVEGMTLTIGTQGMVEGPDIVEKYGDGILNMGYNAKMYFNEKYVMPGLKEFFRECGYK